MKPLWIGVAVLGITLVSFFQFPGHTWLQQDTQIYAPILEHLWDPSMLQRDIVAEHPHVAFTLYDETAIAVRRVTGVDFKYILEGIQFATRALGLWGLYLIASALGLADLLALIVTGIVSLGAFITGPSVLIFEYEPSPRAFAVPLLLLAVGLITRERFRDAGIAASIAFLMHPPTTAPFWAVYLVLVLFQPDRRKIEGLGVLAIAALVLFVASRLQASSDQAQTFFSKLDPQLEELQRIRASYNWVSLWWRDRILQYLILYAATLVAYCRLRKSVPPVLHFFLVGLPLIGIASLPVSYLLLEKLHWALIPEFQPTRALLFVTACAMLLGAAAACQAVAAKRYPESIAWLILVFLPPANTVIEWPSWNRVGVIIGLALFITAAIWLIQSTSRWARLATVAAIVLPAWMIPMWGKQNVPALHTPELTQLSSWGFDSTPRDAMFLFPDAGEDLYPGIFRAEAQRAIYVDWKSGGQVNFFKALGEEWWSRWQQTMAHKFEPQYVSAYPALGIDYIVLGRKNRLSGTTPVFDNGRFLVYKLHAR